MSKTLRDNIPKGDKVFEASGYFQLTKPSLMS